jgi:ferritin-like metal-binding protein YciE
MIKDLKDLFAQHIRLLYSGEEQLLQSLPDILAKVNHRSLKNGLEHHLKITAIQKQRLEEVIDIFNKNEPAELLQPEAQYVCKGMKGLIDEANEILSLGLERDVNDAAIIAMVQKLEHYEITTYGTAIAFAKQLKLNQIEALLNESLGEEYDADDLLTALATAGVNKEAVKEDTAPESQRDEDHNEGNDDQPQNLSQVHITERTINSPGGRAGTSHRRYGTGESRGH